MTKLKITLLASVATAALSLGCSNDTTAPTTTTDNTTKPTTETPSSVLYPLDGHIFWVNISGTNGAITATLVSTTPATAVLGLGIGLRSGECLLTRSVDATAGTQLSVPVEAGGYCVEVFDNGTLTDKVPYSLKITYP